jgi:hypothetical protein
VAPPPTTSGVPVFTSTPVTSAAEDTPYTYQVQVTVSTGAPATLQLTAAPTGATLNSSSISWTPTAAQSRTANNFAVTASVAGGGTATQSWVVTPSGTIVVSSIDTYWTSNGTVSVPVAFPSDNSFPAALVPQPDGSLAAFHGAPVSSGVFAIPGIPGGHYWLEIGPGAIFWTSASAFDFGSDLVGSPLQVTALGNTTLTGTYTGLNPNQTSDWFSLVTDTQGFGLDSPDLDPVGSTSFNFLSSINSNIDFSQVKTIFLAQYEPAAPANLHALAMGPASTLSNVNVINGTVNDLSATLSASPAASLNLSIKGSAWAAAAANVAPTAVTPLGSVLLFSAQPFVTDRKADPIRTRLGTNLPLIAPALTPSSQSVFCSQSGSGVIVNGVVGTGSQFLIQPPILADQNFGTVVYGDPLPAAWPRIFNFCQGFTTQVAIPNSAATQSFVLQNGEATGAPASAVAPLLSPVQNPQLNGASLFAAATLNTTAATLSWTPPATGNPFGYYVQEFVVVTVSGTPQYVPSAKFGVAVNSITLPPLTPGFTYVFLISAVADGKANMEASPRRSALPSAYADVLSAPITVSASAAPSGTSLF